MRTHVPAAVWAVLLAVSVVPPALAQPDDILIADFEGDSYGNWRVEGEAFGPGPARGTLANQMPVTGFLGKGLVNSYFHGDDTTGRLTSPQFRIERRFINFLIGGGKYPGETCINLIVDGNVVHTATGPNDRPGGNERLEWHTWDVRELAGRTATIEIVDMRTGGWGHINVDHIIQSDRMRQPERKRRELVIERRYLHLPVKTGATKRQMKLIAGGQTWREFEIELADGEPADFWAFCDVSSLSSQRLVIELELPSDSTALDSITQDERIRGTGTSDVPPYSERLRPQFHFTSQRGWLNDPNGLTFYNGEYHLFYQHNPFGWNWGNMHWGHAVSSDLLHWKELPTALYPQRFGDWCFSGSAVVDRDNTSGFKQGADAPLVAAYTSTGRGECIAYSTDRGRHWTDFADNPVVRHSGRDPKVIWHEPSHRWVMAVYDEANDSRFIAFYTSPDLKRWEFQSRIEGFFECPDMFELPISGNRDSGQGGPNPNVAKSKWVLYAADGQYLLGEFDGRQFVRESGKHRLWYGNFYAAQTYSNAPDGRRIQIGWGQGITFPNMPFNQQMTLPVALSLRSTEEGLRMFAEPVAELDSLHGRKHSLRNVALDAGDRPLNELRGDLYDIRAEFAVAGKDSGQSFGINVRGIPVVYDITKRTITCRDVSAPLSPVDGAVKLRILVDRGSIEIFGNGGRIALSVGATFPDANHNITLFSQGGPTELRALDIAELSSVWPSKP